MRNVGLSVTDKNGRKPCPTCAKLRKPHNHKGARYPCYGTINGDWPQCYGCGLELKMGEREKAAEAAVEEENPSQEKLVEGKQVLLDNFWKWQKDIYRTVTSMDARIASLEKTLQTKATDAYTLMSENKDEYRLAYADSVQRGDRMIELLEIIAKSLNGGQHIREEILEACEFRNNSGGSRNYGRACVKPVGHDGRHKYE